MTLLGLPTTRRSFLAYATAIALAAVRPAREPNAGFGRQPFGTSPFGG